MANFHISCLLANTEGRNGRKTPVKVKLPFNTKQNRLAGEQRRRGVSMTVQFPILVFHSSLEAMPEEAILSLSVDDTGGSDCPPLCTQVRPEARKLDSCPRHTYWQCRRERVSRWVYLTPKLLAHYVPFLSTLPSPLPVPWRRLWPSGGKIPIRLFQLIFSSTLEASIPVASPVRALSPPHC